MHLALDAKINSCEALTLVDSRATRVFMHPTFVAQCNVVIRSKVRPREVQVINGQMINSGLITHQAQVELLIGNHQETLLADITNTRRYACIFGIPWLVCHDPTIRWSRRQVLFYSLYCHHNCIGHRGVNVEKIRNKELGPLVKPHITLASNGVTNTTKELRSSGLKPVGPSQRMVDIPESRFIEDRGASIVEPTEPIHRISRFYQS